MKIDQTEPVTKERALAEHDAFDRLRRDEAKRKTAEAKRTPISHIPREVATRALLSKRISGKSRRLFTRARAQVIEVKRKEPKLEQEVFCGKLKRLTLLQLGNRADQATRGVRRLTDTLENTTLDSFRKPLEQALMIVKYRQGWIAQEIETRKEKRS